MQVKAILFDTRSIQKYIFSGNMLRTNIGASYLVDRLFEELLVGKVLKPRFQEELDAESWQKGAAFTSLSGRCQVALIGGGNALLLFAEEVPDTELQAIVTEFTSLVLTECPGLRTGAAIMGEGELIDTEEGFRECNKRMHQKLKAYQNSIFPQVNVPYTGLTLSCDVNGEAANRYMQVRAEQRFVSQEVGAKLDAVGRANKRLHEDEAFVDVIAEQYAFPLALDELGQKESEDYIAIVHIDGNNMGTQFSDCRTLAKNAQKSVEVSRKTKRAFRQLLLHVTEGYERYQSFLRLGRDDKGLCYLPLRPLILGGDDVTFVCAAKVAVDFTRTFMQAFKAEGIESCAGIVFLPTSYPFFRGYELAEELCGAAKKPSRNKPGCYLDFLRLHGEQASSLEDIRAQECSGHLLRELHFGPYRVDSAEDFSSLDKLLACSRGLQDGMARNRMKRLRNVLQRDEHDMQEFLQQLKRAGGKLPGNIPLWEAFACALHDEHKRTPYADAIELTEFLPEEVAADE